ncbi:hypothetical protein TNCV_2527201 [Trichonephila clavipes]|nr:hypothetical protein TNCV_2527201 [Trichonephila clavipes]
MYTQLLTWKSTNASHEFCNHVHSASNLEDDKCQPRVCNHVHSASNLEVDNARSLMYSASMKSTNASHEFVTMYRLLTWKTTIASHEFVTNSASNREVDNASHEFVTMYTQLLTW